MRRVINHLWVIEYFNKTKNKWKIHESISNRQNARQLIEELRLIRGDLSFRLVKYISNKTDYYV